MYLLFIEILPSMPPDGYIGFKINFLNYLHIFSKQIQPKLS